MEEGIDYDTISQILETFYPFDTARHRPAVCSGELRLGAA
jgi:hypothetical protein